MFSLTLLELLRRNSIPLPELAGELPADGSGIDVKEGWRIVRERVREVPGFEVVEELTLSTFSFAKYLMWKDLADRAEALKGSPFVHHLIESPHDPYAAGASFLLPREIDDRIDPADLFAPLNADSSQIVAIHASRGDGDFVLEGPPAPASRRPSATSSPTTLCLRPEGAVRLREDGGARCVYRRLHKRGLGRFCLELHSSRASKHAVLDQLGAAWDSAGEYAATEWARKATGLRARAHPAQWPGPCPPRPWPGRGQPARRDRPEVAHWETALNRSWTGVELEAPRPCSDASGHGGGNRLRAAARARL